MKLKGHCQPRPSVFASDRRATVLNLDSLLKGQINGKEFFEENYFTNGMTTLVDRALRHLAGSNSGSSMFMLSQAMGGGKTHSMIGLGLLASDPKLRRSVLGDNDPAPHLGKCRIAGFNGRSVDATGGIWGSIATQLGKEDLFAQYVSPILKAPGPEAWKQLLSGDPLVIFLDELPPYLEYATTVQMGSADLSVATTTALANLFVAVADADLNNVCVILSDLAGTNFTVGQERLQAAVSRAMQGITSEAQRYAIPITPVNPNGDELYHILRKRLFEKIADKPEIDKVAAAYRDALREANKMGLTTTAPDSIFTRIQDSYPFHPDLRELVGKFKENQGFQQTRGIIRLMQMIVSDLWRSGKAEALDLIHPYDLDLNADEIASEVRTISPTLSEAIAHDIAHNGDSEVEQIDAANGTPDASEAARLILFASLSTTPGAIHGLREYQLIDCLQKPGRDLSTFKTNVLDKLGTRAWYLHNSSDGRLFFKNQQNLAAKLRSTALALHTEVVDRKLKERLDADFSASLRDCYQNVKILPPLDDVQLELDKTTLVIVRPGGSANQLPISSDWQEWWKQQQFKNRVLFLSGSRDTFQKVIDAARQSKALQSIEDELRSESTPSDDPQWRALDALRDRIELQFRSALKEAFDQLVYPSINNALRSSGIELAFANNQNGEATIRRTLETAQKFTTNISDDSFRNKAEARLFGSAETKVVLWSDFKRAAAVNTNWQLHKPSALDDLRAECVRRGIWREEGNYVRRGPFPPPAPSVEIRELSVSEDGEGQTYLKIEPLHASRLVYETGDSEPTPASSPVQTPARFEASGLRYRFLAYDPENPERKSPVKEWTARLRLKFQLHNRGSHKEVELKALPKAPGIVIRYTTDGSSPTNASAVTYEAAFKVPKNCRIVCAVATVPALGLHSEVVRIPIPARDETGPTIDTQKPARWQEHRRIDDAAEVWELLRKMAEEPSIVAYDVNFTVSSADGLQQVDFLGTLESGYDHEALKTLVDRLQAIVGAGSLRMAFGAIGFPTGQSLLNWLSASNIQFDMSKVRQ